MPKFKVLSVVEHNETLYWPEGSAGVPPAPNEAPSFGHGKPVPVDASGVVELSDGEAKHLLVGRAIEPLRGASSESRVANRKKGE